MKKMFLECKQAWLSAMAFVVMFVVSMEVLADVPLRRPISPERPMLLVHIDTWNYPDPERIIEMVPQVMDRVESFLDPSVRGVQHFIVGFRQCVCGWLCRGRLLAEGLCTKACVGYRAMCQRWSQPFFRS